MVAVFYIQSVECMDRKSSACCAELKTVDVMKRTVLSSQYACTLYYCLLLFSKTVENFLDKNLTMVRLFFFKGNKP